MLDIYSATSITEPMRLAFADSSSIRFHGAITKDEVDQVQREVDFFSACGKFFAASDIFR